MSIKPSFFWQKISLSFTVRSCLAIDKFVARSNTTRSKTCLIVRTDAIGDYILFRNFLEILNQSKRFSDYKFTLCGNQIWQDLALEYDKDFFEEFIPISRKEFLEDRLYRYNLQKKINKKGFEVAINPTFSDELLFGHSIIRASQAKHRIGSVGDADNLIPKDKKIADSFYTQLLPATSDILFEFDRNKEFFQHLLNEKINIKKPKIPENEVFNQDLIPKKYVVLFSGASTPERCWSASNYRQIAKEIHEKWGLKIVLAGSKYDMPYAQKIEKNNAIPFVNLVGKTSLVELVSLIRNSAFLLTNETSAVHIAAATQTSCICISNNLWHYQRFNPYPKTMNLPVSYIFPAQIQGLKITEIRQKYPKRGMININQILPQEVFELLKKNIY